MMAMDDGKATGLPWLGDDICPLALARREDGSGVELHRQWERGARPGGLHRGETVSSWR